MEKLKWVSSFTANRRLTHNKHYVRFGSLVSASMTNQLSDYYTIIKSAPVYRREKYVDRTIEFVTKGFDLSNLQRLLLKHNSDILLYPHPSITNTYRRKALLRSKVSRWTKKDD